MWIERELRLLSSWIASRGGDCDLEAFLPKASGARMFGHALREGLPWQHRPNVVRAWALSGTAQGVYV